MIAFEKARLSLPQAAFLSGVTVKDINREIDANVITASGAGRCLRGPDIIYLLAIRDWKNEVGPTARRTLRKAITAAVNAAEPTARFYSLTIPVADLRHDVLDQFTQLERLIEDHIEKRDDILAGEAVIRGTRIAARHVANLHRRGATTDQLQDDFDLTAEQIRAAVAYAQTQPQRGRPVTRRSRTTHVPPAR